VALLREKSCSGVLSLSPGQTLRSLLLRRWLHPGWRWRGTGNSGVGADRAGRQRRLCCCRASPRIPPDRTMIENPHPPGLSLPAVSFLAGALCVTSACGVRRITIDLRLSHNQSPKRIGSPRSDHPLARRTSSQAPGQVGRQENHRLRSGGPGETIQLSGTGSGRTPAAPILELPSS